MGADEVLELMRQSYLAGIDDTEMGSPHWCAEGSMERVTEILTESANQHSNAGDLN